MWTLRKKGKVQNKCGEVFIHDTDLKWLANEKNHFKIKMNKKKKWNKKRRLGNQEVEMLKNIKMKL